MKYNFDETIDREGTSSMKLGMIPELYPNAPKNSLALWIADMDFSCPPCALKAIKDRCDKKILGYSKFLQDDYYDAYIGYEKRVHSLDVKKDWVVFSNGVIPAIKYLITILCKEGDGVLMNTPGYTPFHDSVLQDKRKLILSPMKVDEKGRYTLDYADMEKRIIRNKVKVYIFCSPQNPTGRVWTVEEIKKMHALCKKHHVHIISDEIHSDLLREGVTHTPVIALFPNDKDIFTCTAPSKTFNMAGMHLSNIIIKNKKIRDDWYNVQPCGHPSPLSIEAAKACFNEGEEWLGQLRHYLDQNIAYLGQYLRKNLPDAIFYPPEGTYLVWIDLSKYGYSDEEIMRRCVKEGLLIETAPSFVQNGEGHIRINMATPLANIKEACEKLKKALTK
jgi:cystathionine beta-lyase